MISYVRIALVAFRVNRTSTKLHNIWPRGFAYRINRNSTQLHNIWPTTVVALRINRTSVRVVHNYIKYDLVAFRVNRTLVHTKLHNIWPNSFAYQQN